MLQNGQIVSISEWLALTVKLARPGDAVSVLRSSLGAAPLLATMDDVIVSVGGVQFVTWSVDFALPTKMPPVNPEPVPDGLVLLFTVELSSSSATLQLTEMPARLLAVLPDTVESMSLNAIASAGAWSVESLLLTTKAPPNDRTPPADTLLSEISERTNVSDFA